MRFVSSLTSISLVVLPLLTGSTAFAATLQVGPGKTFGAPCDAIKAASDGDIIEIDASGTYKGDVCAVTRNNLTLRGVGGRATIDANGAHHGGKAIWVITGANVVVENIEFLGAKVPDRNGAGIRQEGKNLTVRGCYFHDNENGILTSADSESEILIESTEFAHNGYGDGQSHNLYIGHVKRLTFQFNYSHHAKIGHLLKTRAAENYILYNRLTGESGNQSYEIDVPNGGLTYIIGNLVHQGQNTDNSSMLSYRREGAHANNPSQQLFVVHNSFVSDRNTGIFLNVDPGVSPPAVVRNNIFMGKGTIVTQTNADVSGSFEGDPGFVDKDGFDYRLSPGSPAENAGVAPGTGAGFDLTPTHHYVHPLGAEGRVTVGAIEGSGGSAGSGGSGGTGGSAGSGGGAGSGGTAGSGGSAEAGAGGEGASAGTGGKSESGGSGGSGGKAGSSNAASAASSDAEDDEGCGCRVAHSPAVPWSWAIVVGMMGLAWIRKRKTQGSRTRV